MMRATRKFLSVLALGFFVACGSDLTGPNGVQDDVGRLNLAVRVAVGASASLAPAFDLVLSDGGNTLEIDRVALVLREIELEGDDDGGAC
ncbi:MAG: hypothetical protein OEU54_17285, partial [Gemmatimonadota bacterium]|nr:hypothetical protein [Gemmatimonadota bacterium]